MPDGEWVSVRISFNFTDSLHLAGMLWPRDVRVQEYEREWRQPSAALVAGWLAPGTSIVFKPLRIQMKRLSLKL
jgi:hypothetical protein